MEKYFKVGDSNMTVFLKDITDKLSKDCVKIDEHAYRNMPTLTLRLYDSLNNQKSLENFLQELPQKIGMQSCGNYIIKNSKFIFLKDNGYIFLKESQATVFYRTDGAFVNIFSCKPFDIETAVKYAIECFKPKSLDIDLLYRAKKLS
ncbi:MAG: S-adenosylmethionine decarboxylase [Candidatus Woesearchaeota archaeon]|nr:MAG: S-adenosylmethionine decarboxylase [Candidatus Woesearchaeota archaeon]